MRLVCFAHVRTRPAIAAAAIITNAYSAVLCPDSEGSPRRSNDSKALDNSCNTNDLPGRPTGAELHCEVRRVSRGNPDADEVDRDRDLARYLVVAPPITPRAGGRAHDAGDAADGRTSRHASRHRGDGPCDSCASYPPGRQSSEALRRRDAPHERDEWQRGAETPGDCEEPDHDALPLRTMLRIHQPPSTSRPRPSPRHARPNGVPVSTSRACGSTRADHAMYATGAPAITIADIRACDDSARASAATPSRSRSDVARPSSASADLPPTDEHTASAPA